MTQPFVNMPRDDFGDGNAFEPASDRIDLQQWRQEIDAFFAQTWTQLTQLSESL